MRNQHAGEAPAPTDEVAAAAAVAWEWSRDEEDEILCEAEEEEPADTHPHTGPNAEPNAAGMQTPAPLRVEDDWDESTLEALDGIVREACNEQQWRNATMKRTSQGAARGGRKRARRTQTEPCKWTAGATWTMNIRVIAECGRAHADLQREQKRKGETSRQTAEKAHGALTMSVKKEPKERPSTKVPARMRGGDMAARSN